MMPRLLRISVNIVTAVSALLCLVTGAAWARSYARWDRVGQLMVFGPEGRRSSLDWSGIPGGRALQWSARSSSAHVFLRVWEDRALTRDAIVYVSPEERLVVLAPIEDPSRTHRRGARQ